MKATPVQLGQKSLHLKWTIKKDAKNNVQNTHTAWYLLAYYMNNSYSQQRVQLHCEAQNCFRLLQIILLLQKDLSFFIDNM